jgi:hypothetical protein
MWIYMHAIVSFTSVIVCAYVTKGVDMHNMSSSKEASKFGAASGKDRRC